MTVPKSPTVFWQVSVQQLDTPKILDERVACLQDLSAKPWSVSIPQWSYEIQVFRLKASTAQQWPQFFAPDQLLFAVVLTWDILGRFHCSAAQPLYISRNNSRKLYGQPSAGLLPTICGSLVTCMLVYPAVTQADAAIVQQRFEARLASWSSEQLQTGQWQQTNLSVLATQVRALLQEALENRVLVRAYGLQSWASRCFDGVDSWDWAFENNFYHLVIHFFYGF